METYKLLNEALGADFQSNKDALTHLVRPDFLEILAKQEHYLVDTYITANREKELAIDDTRYITLLVKYLANDSAQLGRTIYLHGMIQAIKEFKDIMEYISLEDCYLITKHHYETTRKSCSTREEEEKLVADMRQYIELAVHQTQQKMVKDNHNHYLLNYILYSIINKDYFGRMIAVTPKKHVLELTYGDKTTSIKLEIDQNYVSILLLALINDANIVNKVTHGEGYTKRVNKHKEYLATRLDYLGEHKEKIYYNIGLLFLRGEIDLVALYDKVLEYIANNDLVGARDLMNTHLQYAYEHNDMALYKEVYQMKKDNIGGKTC